MLGQYQIILFGNIGTWQWITRPTGVQPGVKPSTSWSFYWLRHHTINNCNATNSRTIMTTTKNYTQWTISIVLSHHHSQWDHYRSNTVCQNIDKLQQFQQKFQQTVSHRCLMLQDNLSYYFWPLSTLQIRLFWSVYHHLTNKQTRNVYGSVIPVYSLNKLLSALNIFSTVLKS